MTLPDDLGPLPRADGASELERRSIEALRSALPVADWILREERKPDLGVDLSLEVLVDGAGTNCRSQVQLKGRSNLTLNTDGSFSVAIATANLNYLLNGPTPIYVLYLPETNDLLFTFARDEAQRIEASKPRWKEQQDVTLRFGERLDSASLDRIRERILREARSLRRLQDVAASLAPGERVQVDAASLEPTSPLEAELILTRSGLHAVAHGFANQVLDLYAGLGERRVASNGKLVLVRGYAEFSRGNYLRAYPSLREADANCDQLDSDERHFLRFLLNAADLALGYADNDAFRERSAQWRETAPPLLAAQYDLLEAWLRSSEATSEEGARDSTAELRRAIDRIIAMPEAPTSMTSYAELLRLFLEAQARGLSLPDKFAFASEPALWCIRTASSPADILAQEFAQVRAWKQRMEVLTNSIAAAGDVPLACQAMFTRDLCEEMWLSQLRMVARLTGGIAPGVPDELIRQVRETRSFAAKHGQTEVELRGGLVEMDLQDLEGDTRSAKEVAKDVARRAAALCFPDIARMAQRLLAEGGRHSNQEREIAEAEADGFTSMYATLTPSEEERMAQMMCERLGLSTSRVTVIVDGIRCQKAFAEARATWCRHLQVQERYPDDPRELYASRPERRCVCERMECVSLLPSEDWQSLIPAFKAVHCESCAGREPMASP